MLHFEILFKETQWLQEKKYSKDIISWDFEKLKISLII